MVDLIAFSYRPGSSFLHGLDPRFKLAFIVLISISSLKARVVALCLLSAVLVLVSIHSFLSPKSVLRELRYVLILLALVFTARALSVPGETAFEFKWISVTWQGLYSGGLVCWRLLIVILIGLLFISTTRMSEIKAAVEWYLQPLPLVPEKRVGTMLSLTVRFLPVILEEAGEIADAQRARGIENRKNPVFRLIKFSIPLFRRVFQRADKLALAMEARCYSDNRTNPHLASDRRDWIALFAVVCLCIFIIV